MAEEYDPENIFAKILDGKSPCFKVHETKSSIAILDAFPSCPYHTLLLTKAKGYKTILDMPNGEAKAFLSDLHAISKAVQKASGCAAVNIVGNCGKEAGQTVFHPHFHVIPRSEDDGKKFAFAASTEMLKAEEAAPLQKKLQEILNPPQPLKKPKFGKVAKITPDSKGHNLILKVVEPAKEVELRGKVFWEICCGDGSGTVVVSLSEQQKAEKEMLTEGTVFEVRNGLVKMIKNHIRLVVDKWGKIFKSEAEFEGEVNTAAEKNVSSVEYQLVHPSDK